MAFLASLLGITLAMPGAPERPKHLQFPSLRCRRSAFRNKGWHALQSPTGSSTVPIKVQRSCWNSGTVRSRILCILQMHRSCKRPENFLRPTMSAAGTVSKGSNRAVLDGESFGFYVEFTDGSTISAYGTNSFPPHYREVYSALWDLTAPAQEAYELEHPEESSTL